MPRPGRVSASLALVGAYALVGACARGEPVVDASTTGAPSPETVRVGIGHDGRVTFDGKAVTGAELGDRVRDAARAQPKLELVVDAERDASFQLVMSVVERLRAAGAARIAFGSVLGAPPAGAAREDAERLGGPVSGPPPTPRASIPAGTKWDCAFPRAGGRDGGSANVLVRVHVESDGRPLSVDVLEDPGAGFGEAAKACALAKAYEAARDVNGQPIRSTTYPFYVRFVTR